MTLDPVPPGIFVSYRRDDSRGFAGRLYDRLVDHFDAASVFMDVDSIEPGLDFVEAIERAVGSCRVLLALIGPGWISAADGRRRRIEYSDDLVAVEIRAALDRGVRVIPVLVDGAPMPRREQLPASIQELARRHALHLDHDSFPRDIGVLLDVLDRLPTASPRIPEARAPTTEAVDTPDPTPPRAAQSSRNRTEPAEAAPTLWEASCVRRSTKATDVLTVVLTGGSHDHVIVLTNTSWRRDSLVVDSRPILSSITKYLSGTYQFILHDDARVLACEITLSHVLRPDSKSRTHYIVRQLTVDGRNASLSSH